MSTKELADLSIAQLKTAVEKYQTLKGFTLDSVKGALMVTIAVVKHVQGVGLAQQLAGAEKKALAMEFVGRLTAGLPWWSKMLVNAVMPVVIDLVVEALKDRFEG